MKLEVVNYNRSNIAFKLHNFWFKNDSFKENAKIAFHFLSGPGKWISSHVHHARQSEGLLFVCYLFPKESWCFITHCQIMLPTFLLNCPQVEATLRVGHGCLWNQMRLLLPLLQVSVNCILRCLRCIKMHAHLYFECLCKGHHVHYFHSEWKDANCGESGSIHVVERVSAYNCQLEGLFVVIVCEIMHCFLCNECVFLLFLYT